MTSTLRAPHTAGPRAVVPGRLPARRAPLARACRTSSTPAPADPAPSSAPSGPAPLGRRSALSAPLLAAAGAWLAAGVGAGPAAARVNIAERIEGAEGGRSIEVTATGVRMSLVSPGRGEPPSPGGTVLVEVVGALRDGTVFLDTREGGRPLAFGLGTTNKAVTEGLAQVIETMRGGDVKLAVVPPELGYGRAGVEFRGGARVPPNAPLFYEVTLLRCQTVEGLGQACCPDPAFPCLSDSELAELRASVQPQPPPAPELGRGGTRSLPGGSRPPSGAVAAAVALALSNARRLGQAWRASGTRDAQGGKASGEAPAARKPGRKEAWKLHELEVVVRAVRMMSARTAPEDTNRILAELGWPADRRTKDRVLTQIKMVRARIHHGVDPEEVLQKTRRPPDRSRNYKAWAVKAQESLPGGQGTVEEIGAFMLADPTIAPKLDHRPSQKYINVPEWRAGLFSALTRSGFFNTGVKRGGRCVHGYDPQAGAATKRRRAPSKGDPACRSWASGARWPTNGWLMGPACRVGARKEGAGG
ncbi:hypothetical protein HYH03_019034 [Edaphochlamys debaryana]|uniref:peptidylprolyl isomerase n=1 Tax=Edaphochlamys debaryana TaxID=47281 RepID=A0A835XEV3_9CHLO|nr:hypothetical protein HYH03_019034 [Edaphochlamys debaryana]|eukprot:KAG2482010.1 hypothetical protein HYH03_019034 [Edaphochlamys debaryana]